MHLAETHIAETLEKPIRFQEYAVGIFKTIPTKSGIKKAIKKGFIFIDGNLATTSKYISGKEKIELFQTENSSTFERLKLDIMISDKLKRILFNVFSSHSLNLYPSQDKVGLDRTGHMSFITGQDRTPKFAGQGKGPAGLY